MSVVVGESLELVAGQLYALGGGVEVRGRASWVDPAFDGVQRCNAYLLIGTEEAILVDCGPAIVGPHIVEQLRELLPEGRELSVFLTRAEFETSGNIGLIAGSLPVKAVYVAGRTTRNSPFDGFELAAAPVRGARPLAEIEVHRVAPGSSVPLGGGRRLEVLNAPIRMISASWVYDSGTRALFPSDFFGYTIDSLDVDVEVAFRNLAARYWWLPGARTTNMIADLEAVLDSRSIDIIAPSHGCVAQGASEVARQRQIIAAVLEHATTTPAGI